MGYYIVVDAGHVPAGLKPVEGQETLVPAFGYTAEEAEDAGAWERQISFNLPIGKGVCLWSGFLPEGERPREFWCHCS